MGDVQRVTAQVSLLVNTDVPLSASTPVSFPLLMYLNDGITGAVGRGRNRAGGVAGERRAPLDAERAALPRG